MKLVTEFAGHLDKSKIIIDFINDSLMKQTKPENCESKENCKGLCTRILSAQSGGADIEFGSTLEEVINYFINNNIIS